MQRRSAVSRAAAGELSALGAAAVAKRWADLPLEVQQALYNLGTPEEGDLVATDQIVFYCFNYGAVRSLSYASALPLGSLQRAALLSGWRPKSLSLLRAVLHWRKEKR